MSDTHAVHVVGCGAVGMALVASLVQEGRCAVAVRTINAAAPRETVGLRLQDGADRRTVSVETVGLSRVDRLDGIVTVTAKAYANRAIAAELRTKAVRGPLVVLQNGVGVETPFLDLHVPEVYRCVLYVTSQTTPDGALRFRAIQSSPIGIIQGTEAGLDSAVRVVSTARLPFHAEREIQREIWKKAIMNAIFNSICPLLETDNGVFARDPEVAQLASDVVTECLVLTDRLGLRLTREDLMDQILQISRTSDGQLISTLQDIRHGRETEIEFLNMAMGRTAAAQQPRIELPKTDLLGRMVLAKAKRTAEDSLGRNF